MDRPRGVAIALFALLTILAVPVAVPTLLQEDDPLLVIWGIVRLELTAADIVPVTESTLLQKAGTEEALSRFLAGSGWEFADRLGSAIFYEKDHTRLLVEGRMLTWRYVIYELHDEMGGD